MQNIKSGSKQNSTFYHYIKTTNEKQDYYEAHNNLSKKYCFHSIYKLQEKVTYKLRQNSGLVISFQNCSDLY